MVVDRQVSRSYIASYNRGCCRGIEYRAARASSKRLARSSSKRATFPKSPSPAVYILCAADASFGFLFLFCLRMFDENSNRSAVCS